jgi:hypothetical protein
MQQAWNEREANYQPWYAFFKSHHSPWASRWEADWRRRRTGGFVLILTAGWYKKRDWRLFSPRSKLGDVMELKTDYDNFFTSGSNHEPSVKMDSPFTACENGTNWQWYIFSQSSQVFIGLTHFRINSENASRSVLWKPAVMDCMENGFCSNVC